MSDCHVESFSMRHSEAHDRLGTYVRNMRIFISMWPRPARSIIQFGELTVKGEH